LGEQSPARHRHRRRDEVGDDAERLGRNLARAEEDHPVDRRQRGPWHTDARQSEVSGPASLSYIARELRAVVPHAVPDGGGKPLSHVWKVEKRSEYQP